MFNRFRLLTIAALLLTPVRNAQSGESSLRLVPYPKQVESREGTFPLDKKLLLEVSAEEADLLGPMIGRELTRAGFQEPEIRSFQGIPGGIQRDRHALRLSVSLGESVRELAKAEDTQPEGYLLDVRPDQVVCRAVSGKGLSYGVHTLCQLIRANRQGDAIPCVVIRDWPSLRWRCFQDDLTRGPSSTLATLQRHVDLGSNLKMNLFTYYMEYQYAFKKHPIIGPKDGSLQPEDLATLVEYGRSRHVDILGNQQSFAHFTHILKHEQFAALRETPYLLSPVKEETYQLLDDLYSEVCPLLPLPMFNVCCDETIGLGEGPAKKLAGEIGVGGVYVRHIRRVHDLIKNKYGKRMMMWGDIILNHPDHLSQIPKDTIMLTWGYDAAPSYEHQIIPFSESGYEFWVCPGINNWLRILPDFGVATTNIHNFVRDGVKHGATGMLNTAWEDDGEALQGYKWHGYAWGAECAWNASSTTPDQFNRRIGAVLFGEPNDHFGQAIERLAETHRLPDMDGMRNGRFWKDDFVPARDADVVRTSADQLLAIVRPAIDHLEACRAEATVNADLLDGFLFGARRMELIGQRMLDGLAAAGAYQRACGAADRQDRLAALAEAERLVRVNRDAHESLGQEFQRLWLAESKPYALDWTMQRYAKVVRQFDVLARRLEDTRKQAEAGQPLPEPKAVGLALP